MTNRIDKDIDVCGIGNALVDIQVEVVDAIIEDFNLKKGEMQLASADRQSLILESLIDFKQHKSSGGSAANTIIAFSQFGGKAGYKTSLGFDDLGEFYAKEFTDLDIELSAKLINDQPTGTCLVLITPDSERTMVTALSASAFFSKDDLNEELIRRSKWIYIEGYELTQQNSADAMIEAVKMAKLHNTKIAITFSDIFITQIFYERLKFIADNSDLIFCNESEAMAFTKSNNLDSALIIFDRDFKNYAVTKGAKGSIVKWNNEKISIESYPADPKDSTGAGDMYAGAFLYGLISTGSAKKAGHLGSYASALVVSQLGARLKKRYEEIKDKIFNEINE